MEFLADLHLHSYRSIATSKECVPPVLARWATVKGLQLIGTGDFTHPGWRRELRECLEPVGNGLYRLKDGSAETVRFVVSGEISTVYKKAGRTRKVHSLILMPSLEAADRLSALLEGIGNIRADGRPILGLDCRTLLQLCLDVTSEVIFIPAHIWTPHFSVLGAASGFDSFEECFDDLTGEIKAVETGLSSDPPMNWRLSMLDRFALVSNSDAHSPRNLAREANRFDCELSYAGVRQALATRKGLLGTVEFYPEEGKYHLDGHRSCGVSLTPSETLALGGKCPVCGKKLTIGVLHRVERLADRDAGYVPAGAPAFERIVPLGTLIASALGVGAGTRAVEKLYQDIIRQTGSELAALRQAPIEEITRVAGPLVGEAVRRSRFGGLKITAGFDGQYGVITAFDAAERARAKTGGALFNELPENPPKATSVASTRPEAAASEAVRVYETESSGRCPSADQLRAITAEDGPVVIIAGPGSGKTSTLVGRIAHLVHRRRVDPAHITAVTFTRRAAGEMRKRLEEALGRRVSSRINLGTFHQLMLQLLREHYREDLPRLIGEEERREMVVRAAQSFEEGDWAALDRRIGLLKARGLLPDACGDDPVAAFYRAYQQELQAVGAMDYDDILIHALELMRGDSPTWQRFKTRFAHLLVDEFQDVNAVQYELVIRAVGDARNLFVIGDPDQSIYAFRGSDPRLFSGLMSDFPGCNVIALAENFRSAPPIVEAAANVISAGPGAARVHRPTRRISGRVRHIIVPDERHEGIVIAHEIARMLGGTDMLSAHGQRRELGEERLEGAALGFSDFAVLFRTARQSQGIEECFLKEGLPYRVVGREAFLRDSAVRHCLDLLHYVADERDLRRGLSFLRACAPAEEQSLSRAWDRLLQNQGSGSLEEVVSTLYGGELPSWVRAACDEAGEIRRLASHCDPADLVHHWISKRQSEEYSPLNRLYCLAWGWKRLADFLQVVDGGLDGDLDRKGFNWSDTGAVSLMTLHAAKGLEFDVVFIAGVEEGLLPLGEGLSDGEVEEERRLLYVGMTRACRELIVLSCRRRHRRGEGEARRASRFLADVPPGLMTVEHRSEPTKSKQLRLFGVK